MKINRTEVFRKSIHISSLIIPVLYRYGFHYNRKLSFLFLVPLTIFLIIFDTLRLEHRTWRRFSHNFFGIILRKHEQSDFTGAVYVMFSAVLCIALFPGNIAFMALSFLAIGDTLAAVIGISFGKRKLRGQKKSLEGSLACFLGTFVYGFAFYIFDFHLGLSLGTLLLGAAVATLVEAWNVPFDDNLKIPLISGLFMYLSTLIF